MELLKALFESAELPAEFKEKTTTLFEAAVAERLAAEITSIQEAAEKKLDEAKATFFAEATASIDAVVEDTVLEWAKENAVALDSEIKSTIAESFLQGLKGIFEKADIELSGDTAGKELVKLQEANAELVKSAEAAKTALVEAQSQLTQIKIKEIIAEVTAGLADTQVHRVTKLVEAFEFKTEADFRAKAALVVEAVGGKIVAVNNNDGTPLAVTSTSGKVSNTVETPGVENEDGELVKKPAGASVHSADGAKGTPDATKDASQPGLPGAHSDGTREAPGGAVGVTNAVKNAGDPLKKTNEAFDLNEYAPHLNADLVAETMKLFK